MIQRIQSLYLFAASGILFSLFFRNLTRIGDLTVKFTEYTPFLVLTIVTFAISFLSIFLYRNRMRQMRFCIYNLIVLCAFQAWILFMFFTRAEGTVFSISAVFPIVAGILTYMAFRKIGEDEALVQGMNSLRSLTKKKQLWKK